MKKFKNLDGSQKAHLICILVIVFSLLLFIVWRVSYVQTVKQDLENYEVINAENFDIDTNIRNLFLHGHLSTEQPVIYDGKEYAMVRYITVKYSVTQNPATFNPKDGVLYEQEILKNQNINVSYETKYGEDVKFGNLQITDEQLPQFKPYIIDFSYDSSKKEQTFVSVLNMDKNYIAYIKSVEYGSMSDISAYQNMEEARKDLTPWLIVPILLGCLVALVAYFICLMSISLSNW